MVSIQVIAIIISYQCPFNGFNGKEMKVYSEEALNKDLYTTSY